MRKKCWKKIAVAGMILATAMMFDNSVTTQASSAEITIEGEQQKAYGGDTGTCGTYANWSLDNEGNLIISGSGEIKEFKGLYLKSRVKNIVVQEGITAIGAYAFEDLSNMVSISLPSTLVSIGNSAFDECSSLTSVVIPSGVTSIGERVFDECSSLTSVVIPSGVTSIGKSTFDECSNLTTVTLPEGITSIGEYAFYKCSNLKEITLPSTLTSIGQRAFYGCSSLSYIEIPSGVTSIEEYTFNECSSLTTITLPAGIKTIATCAFNECSSLASVALPGSITWMGKYVFDDCDNLTLYCYKDTKGYDYAIENEIPYEIMPRLEEKAKVTLSRTSYTYDGKAKKPKVTVKVKGTVLAEGTDYTVTYIDNVYAGQATVRVEGIGNHYGIITKNFTIEAKLLKEISVELKSQGKKTLKPKRGKGTFKTSNAKIVSVGKEEGTSCTIQGRKAGTAKVTFQTKTIKIVYKVKVKKYTKKVNVNITSGNTRELKPKCGEGKWKSSNSKIVSLSGRKGETCTIRGKNTGTAKVTFEKDSFKLIYTVKVKGFTQNEKLELLSCDVKYLHIGTIMEQGGTWTTSDSGIIEIDEKDGKSCTIRGKQAGTAQVTYQKDGRKVVYTVTVKNPANVPLSDAYIDINFVGGVEPHIKISNTTGKTIKYVKFKATFYNAVNDMVYSDIGNYAYINYTITGPLEPWRCRWYEMETAFYNYSAAKMHIGTVEVIFMDGSKQNVPVNLLYPER